MCAEKVVSWLSGSYFFNRGKKKTIAMGNKIVHYELAGRTHSQNEADQCNLHINNLKSISDKDQITFPSPHIT